MTSALANLRIAIVGSGPSGFYAAEALQKAAPEIRIDMYDRLPTPYGLVRGGVAPDHQKIKSVTRVFDRIATRPGFRFLGNVEVGRDISVDELSSHYDAVVFAVGAAADRRLGIPGEAQARSHAATEFVGWYNGHPDYADRHFDLSQGEVAVVGLGNVAIDITRILVSPIEHLAKTDIAEHALAALRNAQVHTVHLVARRGPVQAACTTPELRELGAIPGVEVIVAPSDLVLDAASATLLAEDTGRTAEKNLELFRQWSTHSDPAATKRIVFHFCVSPVELLGEHGVAGMQLVRNTLEADSHGNIRAVATTEAFTIPVGLVFRSVGYRGNPVPGLPFDPARGVIPNSGGRVIESVDSHTPVRGFYVAGWIKRGPTGVIGTNKSCATETMDLLMADAAAERLAPPAQDEAALDALLRSRGIRVTTWQDWERLDREEQSRGADQGKPRSKLTNVSEMLRVIAP